MLTLVDDLWSRIERALQAVDPRGEALRGPASERDLRALVPPSWRALWARHDGQTSLLDGLFDGWFFLPLRGRADSVAAHLEGLPDGWVPLAKDFGGSYLVVRPDDDALVVWDVDEGAPTGRFAADVEELLGALLERLEAGDLPGRWQPESELEVRVDAVEALPIGARVSLGHGLVWVRLAAEAVPATARGEGQALPFAVDAEDGDPEATGRLVGVRVLGGAGVAQLGEQHWIEARHLRSTLTLLLTIDLEQPITGPRPVLAARSDDPVEAAHAHLLLGDPEGGLERLGSEPAEALRARLHAARTRQVAAPPRVPPPAPEPDPLPPDRVTVLPDGYRVVLTPDEAARGAVAVVRSQGVRLPAGAGHGLALTLAVGRIEAQVRLPDGWSPDPAARNDSLSFERWDVLASVALSEAEVASGAEVPVATLEGLQMVHWPAGASEVRVAGAGLAKPRGERGDLVVRRRGR